MKYPIALCFYMLTLLSGFAQEEPLPQLQSIDGVLNELLDQITIEQGEQMDTAAVRTLFHPAAIFTVADSTQAETVSLDDFLNYLKDPYYEEGYLEQEITKTVDTYNGIAQVFQTFYGKDSEGTEEKGINSYQLTYYNNRWWIVSLLWTIETEQAKIPEQYGGE
ncbi:MAG: hypothetical protein ABGW88_18175 [Leeuwenhoekiella sp.]|uniref:hypothetical protein n=1 Tax=Leeuwenhoekiella TaxID=283735 RepID=UPI000C5E0AE2|nr:MULTISPECIES: hypothetical protein [Leeuwenhoekiella]MAO42961.1 hypothetical protein [Leeuwenhoekiella sp.]HCW63621.1 hypothetical protein [Leeuwenhoekiella sp.]|tara:strand:- start:733 stop:1224 length:492 start_codon:yes stop_codon:yes gene_type:complete